MEEPGKPVDEEEDDEVQLSISTLAALNEFLSEKNEREEKLRRLPNRQLPTRIYLTKLI